MSGYRRRWWFLVWLLLAMLLGTSDAGAEFVTKPKLARADVQTSVAEALRDLTGNQLSLLEIVGVFQPGQTQLNPRSTTVNNVAAILASLSGTVTAFGGVPIVYDGNIEQVICNQLTNNR